MSYSPCAQVLDKVRYKFRTFAFLLLLLKMMMITRTVPSSSSSLLSRRRKLSPKVLLHKQAAKASLTSLKTTESSFFLALDTFSAECITNESNAVNGRLYAHADIFRRAQTRTCEMKEDLAREIENEIRASSKREHIEAARARKKIDQMQEEFQRYREDVAALTTIRTTKTKRKCDGDEYDDNEDVNVNDDADDADNRYNTIDVMQMMQTKTSGNIQTIFFIRKDDCDECNRAVRLVGSCKELGQWDVQKSTELKKVDKKDNLYACSLDMSAKSVDDGFKFKFFTCAKKENNNVEDVDWQTCEDGSFRNAIDGSGETIALNFTVDWMGNKEEERVWVCQSLER